MNVTCVNKYLWGTKQLQLPQRNVNYLDKKNCYLRWKIKSCETFGMQISVGLHNDATQISRNCSDGTMLSDILQPFFPQISVMDIYCVDTL